MRRLVAQLEAERAAPGVAGTWPGPAAPDSAHLLALARRLGITRLADLTGLDRTGCPVVQAVRPGSRANVVSQGKGRSLAEAARSAVLEAAEAWAAERALAVCARTTFHSLPDAERRRLDGLDSLALRPDWREHELDWVDADDLTDGAPTLLPTALVSTDYRLAAAPPVPLLVESTTGLGAGDTAHRASLQGLLECIERDAVARAGRTHGFFERCRIDLGGAEGTLGELVRRLGDRGLLLGAWAAPGRVALPVVWCRMVERDTPGRLLPFPAEGMACAFDPHEAAEKALLEAAQARVTVIAGAREDITRHAYRAPVVIERGRLERMLETTRPTLVLGRLPRLRPPSPATALRWLVDELRRSGTGPPLGIALATPGDLGAAVVRIVVPGLLALAA
jgi:ribosomal protein S12 methylthiotransferase accessory factor